MPMATFGDPRSGREGGKRGNVAVQSLPELELCHCTVLPPRGRGFFGGGFWPLRSVLSLKSHVDLISEPADSFGLRRKEPSRPLFSVCF